MKSSVEVLEDNKVKVYVEVEEDEFDRDIDKAFKLIAKEVNLPGFRAGKVPRRVLEARVGIGPAREQALRDAVPEYLAKAVKEHDVDLVAQPAVEITDGQETGPVEFDATCEVRPIITVPGYAGLRIELPSVVVSDDDITEAQEAELAREAILEPVERPAEEGDFVIIDMAATRDGKPAVGLNTEDYTYEIGQGWVTDDFDEHLIGASAGDELTFASTPKGTDEPADFAVTVQVVQTREFPELTDEWVDENIGEFTTVEEWTESLRTSLAESKWSVARQQAGTKINEALAELVELDPPEAMVNSDLSQRVQGTMQQFQAQGIDFEQWMQATGQDPEQFVEGMRGQSELAVKVDLALRAVAEAENIEVDDDELEREYARMAIQYQQKAKDIRKAYEQNDAVPELVAQIRKSKAFDFLVHSCEYVDEAGNSIDRDELIGHTDEETHVHSDDDVAPANDETHNQDVTHDQDDHDHDHDDETEPGATTDVATEDADR